MQKNFSLIDKLQTNYKATLNLNYCYRTISRKVFIESTLASLNRHQHKPGQSCANSIKHVQIQSFDNYTLVISLVIGQWSEDLKHRISGNGLPELQG